MTPAELYQAGELLFGARWQSELARELGVADRTVRRWLAAAVPVPAGVVLEVVVLLVNRRARLQLLEQRLAEQVDPAELKRRCPKAGRSIFK